MLSSLFWKNWNWFFRFVTGSHWKNRPNKTPGVSIWQNSFNRRRFTFAYLDHFAGATKFSKLVRCWFNFSEVTTSTAWVWARYPAVAGIALSAPFAPGMIIIRTFLSNSFRGNKLSCRIWHCFPRSFFSLHWKAQRNAYDLWFASLFCPFLGGKLKFSSLGHELFWVNWHDNENSCARF